MSRRAVQRQRSRARAAAVGAERAAASGAAPIKPKTHAEPIPELNGIQWLASKNRLNRMQRRALEAYGARYRLDVMGGGDSLKSSLDDMPRGGGVGIPETCLETAAWIASAKKELAGARAALGFNTAMVATCDLVAGQGLRPREITTNQAETGEIETTLRIAGDLLYSHFKEIRII